MPDPAPGQQIQITVKLGAPLSQVVGASQMVLTLPRGATVADALEELRNRHPEWDAGLKGKGLRRPFDQMSYSLFLNARPVSIEAVARASLRDGDRLYFFLPVAGGN